MKYGDKGADVQEMQEALIERARNLRSFMGVYFTLTGVHALHVLIGIGVIFSVVPLVLYQGGITLAAGWVQGFLTDPVVAEMNATGGLLILAIGLDILQIRKVPVGNLLPAIFVAAAIAVAIG